MAFNTIPFWQLIAGLGLFLFGMDMLEEALKIIAGRSFKKFLRKQTGNPIKAVLAGASVTAILQSSSMVTLLVMSFTGTGIITLKSGIGMILGANLGTTVTGWLVSLVGFKTNFEPFIFPFIAFGTFAIIFFKSAKMTHIGRAILGFSFMFWGLSYMKNGFVNFASNIDLHFLQSQPNVIFLLFGFMLAATIQSSSAAITIFLASLASGIISLPQAAFLVIGADLGTTITSLLGTIKANEIKKKTGWSQFYINVFSSTLALVLMTPLFYLIQQVFYFTDPLIVLVLFHSLFNFIGIIFLLPFLGLFTKMIDQIISHDDVSIAKYLANANPDEQHTASEALTNEAKQFLLTTIALNSGFFRLTSHREEKGLISYADLKKYEMEITDFYTHLQENLLNETEVAGVNNISAAIRNAVLSVKDVKDIKHNLDEIRNSENDELYQLWKLIKSSQHKLYIEINLLITDNSNAETDKPEQLKSMNKKYNLAESQNILKIYHEQSLLEVNLSSLLNMVRDINISNESLIRAVTYYLEHRSSLLTNDNI